MGAKRAQGADRQRAYLGLTMRELTDELNRRAGTDAQVKRTHVVNSLYGNSRPNETLRRYLPEILGISLEACFDSRALEKPHDERKAAR